MNSKPMQEAARPYLPAAGRDWALPFYDPLVKLLGADKARRVLLDQAAVQPDHRILDIGSGTGTFAIAIKQLYPEVKIIGLDPDPKALARARRKTERAAVSVRFDQGYSNELPYSDGSFDRVFSCFMFHHLEAEQREKTLHEIRRVLAPGGSFHLLDFERPEAQGHGFLSRLHASHHLKDNSESRILALIREAGFVSEKKVAEGALLFGMLRMGYYRASVI